MDIKLSEILQEDIKSDERQHICEVCGDLFLDNIKHDQHICNHCRSFFEWKDKEEKIKESLLRIINRYNNHIDKFPQEVKKKFIKKGWINED